MTEGGNAWSWLCSQPESTLTDTSHLPSGDQHRPITEPPSALPHSSNSKKLCRTRFYITASHFFVKTLNHNKKKSLRTQGSHTRSSFPEDCLRPEGRPCRSLLSWCCSFRLVTGSRASDLCGWKTVRQKRNAKVKYHPGSDCINERKMVTTLLASIHLHPGTHSPLRAPGPVTRVYPAGRRCDSPLLCPLLLLFPFPRSSPPIFLSPTRIG